MAMFTKQVVGSVAEDLSETATAIANKEREGCTCSIMRYGTWGGGMPSKTLASNGDSYRLGGLRSRLVIVAHGDSTSTCINGNAKLTGEGAG